MLLDLGRVEHQQRLYGVGFEQLALSEISELVAAPTEEEAFDWLELPIAEHVFVLILREPHRRNVDGESVKLAVANGARTEYCSHSESVVRVLKQDPVLLRREQQELLNAMGVEAVDVGEILAVAERVEGRET